MPTERKSIAEMLGEVAREAAVLLALFIPLETVLIREEPLTWRRMGAIVAIAGGLLFVGIVTERLRPNE